MGHAASTRSPNLRDCSRDAPRDRYEKARVLRVKTQADVSRPLSSNTWERLRIYHSLLACSKLISYRQSRDQRRTDRILTLYTYTVYTVCSSGRRTAPLPRYAVGLAISCFNLRIRATPLFPVTSSFPQTPQLHLVLLRPFQRNLLLSRSCISPLFLLLRQKRWTEIQGDCEQESGQRKALTGSELAKWH